MKQPSAKAFARPECKFTLRELELMIGRTSSTASTSLWSCETKDRTRPNCPGGGMGTFELA